MFVFALNITVSMNLFLCLASVIIIFLTNRTSQFLTERWDYLCLLVEIGHRYIFLHLTYFIAAAVFLTYESDPSSFPNLDSSKWVVIEANFSRLSNKNWGVGVDYSWP